MESPSTSNLCADEKELQANHVYRIDLSYIGSEFLGWQSQPQGNTVQDLLEKALSLVLREKIRVLGASRTDTGVHAEHQVATFRCANKVDTQQIQRSLSALLPPSIGVYGLREVNQDFHPIVHACSKLYRYRIWQGGSINPFIRPYVWTLPKQLDLSSLLSASSPLLGHHSFKSFCASDATVKTYERTIFDLQWVSRGPLLEFYVLGDGFLKQMVRSLVGTLVDVGAGRRSAQDMERLLKAEDRTKAGQTAPAGGLSLVNIFYESQTKIPVHHLEPAELLGFSLFPLGSVAKEQRAPPSL